jgi:hypothetical protein
MFAEKHIKAAFFKFKTNKMGNAKARQNLQVMKGESLLGQG